MEIQTGNLKIKGPQLYTAWTISRHLFYFNEFHVMTTPHRSYSAKDTLKSVSWTENRSHVKHMFVWIWIVSPFKSPVTTCKCCHAQWQYEVPTRTTRKDCSGLVILFYPPKTTQKKPPDRKNIYSAPSLLMELVSFLHIYPSVIIYAKHGSSVLTIEGAVCSKGLHEC